jgi:predicted transcriptional regulator
MGQEEVLKVLAEKDLATAEEISELLAISVGSVRESLNQMLKFNEVEKIKTKVKNARPSFAWKIVIVRG